MQATDCWLIYIEKAVPKLSDLEQAKHLIGAGRFEEASEICRRLITKDDHDEAVYLLAVITGQTGLFSESRTLFERAIMNLPDRSDVTYNYGVVLNTMGKHEEAVKQWTRTLAVNPGHDDAIFNLGRAHADSGAWKEAAEYFEHFLRLHPDKPRALLNLGNVHYRTGSWQPARSYFQRIVTLDDSHVQGWINLGLTEYRDGNPEAAIAHLRKALDLEPNNINAHVNIAQPLLSTGNMREGFAENEWRRKVQDLSFPVTGQQAWNGTDPIDRRILLYAEQGQGDAIHFLRYVSILAKRGASVRVYCHPSLTALAKWVAGVESVYCFGDPPPEFDTYAPLMSLPHLLQLTDIEAAPRVPYIMPPANAALPGAPLSPRVGIAWAGNPEHEDDANRTCPLTVLKPLIDNTPASFFSLQVGTASGEIEATGLSQSIADIGNNFRNFFDTAAAIQSLDLVISVDSAVAHLAGAIGKPVWLMLPRVPDWRWPRQGTETPWYPSMRLFRAVDDGDWSPVVAEMQSALAENVAC